MAAKIKADGLDGQTVWVLTLAYDYEGERVKGVFSTPGRGQKAVDPPVKWSGPDMEGGYSAPAGPGSDWELRPWIIGDDDG